MNLIFFLLSYERYFDVFVELIFINFILFSHCFSLTLAFIVQLLFLMQIYIFLFGFLLPMQCCNIPFKFFILY
ncbi:unnamed protein product [Larinioides sclopetarius]|uniref:Uncharacterized protein n=1 Tax=Larinioides sclopetarius TaxID=280406 RepID=A0AAV2BDX0_9ARAC